MNPSYRFSVDDIALFKQQVHDLRAGLRVYHDEGLPGVRRMLDIWARCLGYPGHQVLMRQSRGHGHRSDYPVKLTPESFVALAEALHQALSQPFTLEQCRWAVAGLYPHIETGLSDQVIEQLSKLITLQEAEALVPGDRQWLVEQGFLIRHGQAREALLLPGMTGAFYDITLLGQYVAGQVLERRQGYPLDRINLLGLGLPDSLCRLKAIHRSFAVSWGTAQPVSSTVTLTTRSAQPVNR